MESGLLSLRAELHKKKSQLSKSQELNVNLKPLYKEPKKSKEKKCKLSNKIPVDDEESLKLQKSRQALEKKALIYDQIKNGTEVLEDNELNEKFLVDFQGKIYKEISDAKEDQKKLLTKVATKKIDNDEDSELYNAKDASEEWVEYIDSFGRTRMCLQKDVDYMKGKHESGKTQNLLQEKWEKIEDDSKVKNDIHYQDVLFDEARSHGTAFMPFSRDETEREAQQQLLKDIRSQATKVTISKDALKRKRQKLMEERLAKVRQKKRLKMGLPVKDDDRYKTPPTSDEEDITSEQVPQNSENITEVPLVDDAGENKETRVREWDIGKPGVSSLLSQTQWIESRRKERENEFAPPTNYSSGKIYDKKNITKVTSNSSPSNQTDNLMNQKREERSFEFAPPSTFDYYGPSTHKRNYSFKPRVDLEAAISKGLSQIRKDFENKDE